MYMKLTYLGTGGAEGIPGVFCQCPVCKEARRIKGKNIKTRSCTLIDRVLIDISPDIFMQSLWCDVDLSSVNNLLITHTHSDHLNASEICMRLRDMASILEAGQPEVFEIYGTAEAHQVIKDAIVRDRHVNQIRLNFHQIHAFETMQIAGLRVTSLKANHNQNEECLLYVLQNSTGCVLYANDTGRPPEETLNYIAEKGYCFDVVSMDTGRGTLTGDSHMSLEDNLFLRKQLEEMGAVHSNTKYLLNHYSHMCSLLPDEYQKLVEPCGFQLTYDGMTVEVGMKE